MITGMGYDLHITRAIEWFDSERYPILGADADALVRDEPELTILPDEPPRPDFRFLVWKCATSDNEGGLWLDHGRLQTKNPEPELVRRMTDWAARWDAWVVGD